MVGDSRRGELRQPVEPADLADAEGLRVDLALQLLAALDERVQALAELAAARQCDRHRLLLPLAGEDRRQRDDREHQARDEQEGERGGERGRDAAETVAANPAARGSNLDLERLARRHAQGVPGPRATRRSSSLSLAPTSRAQATRPARTPGAPASTLPEAR